MSTKFRKRLARVLNESIPEWRGFKLEWRADSIYGARGIWRQKRMDVCSWTATAYDAARPTQSILHVDCWETMTECVKAGAVGINPKGDLVHPVAKGKP